MALYDSLYGDLEGKYAENEVIYYRYDTIHKEIIAHTVGDSNVVQLVTQVFVVKAYSK